MTINDNSIYQEINNRSKTKSATAFGTITFLQGGKIKLDNLFLMKGEMLRKCIGVVSE